MSMIGVGLYTFREAARLTSIPARDLSRWLRGYASRKHGAESSEPTWQPPLWEGEFADEEFQAIGFHDLLEVRFVHAFRRHGVSLRTIRRASENARELFDHPYPFTCKRFQTDGRSIFATAAAETGDTELLDLVRRQYALHPIIEASLYAGIDFNGEELAKRWYPNIDDKRVFLDPEIAFGKPVVQEGGVKTAILYDAFKAEDSVDLVSRLYEVPVGAVEAAIAFEERLAA